MFFNFRAFILDIIYCKEAPFINSKKLCDWVVYMGVAIPSAQRVTATRSRACGGEHHALPQKVNHGEKKNDEQNS